MNELMVFAPMGGALVYSEKKQDEIIQRINDRIESCWGTGRPLHIINPDDYKKELCWAYWARGENLSDPMDKEGEAYHGHHLILIRFITTKEFETMNYKESIEPEISQYFETFSKGFFY
jgi:hypothetical protein